MYHSSTRVQDLDPASASHHNPILAVIILILAQGQATTIRQALTQVI
jgi:hypothetical protein